MGPSYMTSARMHTTRAMMPTPSTSTAASNMVVWIFPCASGCRAIPSTAAAPIRPYSHTKHGEAGPDARPHELTDLLDVGSESSDVHVVFLSRCFSDCPTRAL